MAPDLDFRIRIVRFCLFPVIVKAGITGNPEYPVCKASLASERIPVLYGSVKYSMNEVLAGFPVATRNFEKIGIHRHLVFFVQDAHFIYLTFSYVRHQSYVIQVPGINVFLFK